MACWSRRLGEVSDGQYQKYFVESGAYFRQNLFGTDPRLLKMVEHLSDDQLARMRLGGHDPIKVHAAFRAAVDTTGAPTIVLAKTIKGYGLGRGWRRQEHYAPAEKTERGRVADVPLALRNSYSRR